MIGPGFAEQTRGEVGGGCGLLPQFICFYRSSVALGVFRLPCNVSVLLLNFYKAFRIYEVFLWSVLNFIK